MCADGELAAAGVDGADHRLAAAVEEELQDRGAERPLVPRATVDLDELVRTAHHARAVGRSQATATDERRDVGRDTRDRMPPLFRRPTNAPGHSGWFDIDGSCPAVAARRVHDHTNAEPRVTAQLASRRARREGGRAILMLARPRAGLGQPALPAVPRPARAAGSTGRAERRVSTRRPLGRATCVWGTAMTRRDVRTGVLGVMLLCLLPALALAQATQQFEPQFAQPGKDVVWVPTPEAMVDRDARHGEGHTRRCRRRPRVWRWPAGDRGGEARRTGPWRRVQPRHGAAVEATGARRGRPRARDVRRRRHVRGRHRRRHGDGGVPAHREHATPAGPSSSRCGRARASSPTRSAIPEWPADARVTRPDCTAWCTALLWMVPARSHGDWQIDGRADAAPRSALPEGVGPADGSGRQQHDPGRHDQRARRRVHDRRRRRMRLRLEGDRLVGTRTEAGRIGAMAGHTRAKR